MGRVLLAFITQYWKVGCCSSGKWHIRWEWGQESIGLTQLACLSRFHTKGGVRNTRVALHTQSTSFWLGEASTLKHDNLALKRTWLPLTIQSLGFGSRKNNAAWIWNSRRDYLDWNWARMLLLILREKKKEIKGKPSRKIKFNKKATKNFCKTASFLLWSLI